MCAAIVAAEQPIPAEQIDSPRRPTKNNAAARGRTHRRVGSPPNSVRAAIDAVRGCAKCDGAVRREGDSEHGAADQGRRLLRPASSAIDRGQQSRIGAHQQMIRIARINGHNERRTEKQSDICIEPGTTHAARAEDSPIGACVVCHRLVRRERSYKQKEQHTRCYPTHTQLARWTDRNDTGGPSPGRLPITRRTDITDDAIFRRVRGLSLPCANHSGSPRSSW